MGVGATATCALLVCAMGQAAHRDHKHPHHHEHKNHHHHHGLSQRQRDQLKRDYPMPSDAQLKELRESNKLVIWVLGGPGSGKGTQCKKIVEKYQFTHISTGDLLRAEVEAGSERAKKLNAIMKEGALVPMNVVLALLAERMIATFKTANGFLIDGYPRELSQGQEFEKSIKPCDLVLYMKATDATLKSRLLHRAKTSGRTDDNEETILKRLKTFHDHSDPIINNYTSKVKEIDSERDPEVIFADVVQAIDAVKK